MYTSSSLSLAILETLVHLDSHEVLAKRYCRIVSEFPKSICETLDPTLLPPGWDSDIPVNFTRNAGDKWLNEARSAVLAVPSALSPGEMNFLLNPDHKDFALVTLGVPERFIFSKRFLK